MSAIDPNTGRPFGDHGSIADAVDYGMTLPWGEDRQFIGDWTHGDLKEWPEFYPWLAQRESARSTLNDADNQREEGK